MKIEVFIIIMKNIKLTFPEKLKKELKRYLLYIIAVSSIEDPSLDIYFDFEYKGIDWDHFNGQIFTGSDTEKMPSNILNPIKKILMDNITKDVIDNFIPKDIVDRYFNYGYINLKIVSPEKILLVFDYGYLDEDPVLKRDFNLYDFIPERYEEEFQEDQIWEVSFEGNDGYGGPSDYGYYNGRNVTLPDHIYDICSLVLNHEFHNWNVDTGAKGKIIIDTKKNKVNVDYIEINKQYKETIYAELYL